MPTRQKICLLIPFLLLSFSVIFAADKTSSNSLTEKTLSPNAKLSPDALKKEQAKGYELMPAMTDTSNLVTESLQKLMKSDYSSKREQFKKHQSYTDAIYTKEKKLYSIKVSYDGLKYTLTLDEYNFETKKWKEVVETKKLTAIQYNYAGAAGGEGNKSPILEDKGYIFITGEQGVLIYNSNTEKTLIAQSEYKCYPKITTDNKLLLIQSNGNVIIYDYLNAKI